MTRVKRKGIFGEVGPYPLRIPFKIHKEGEVLHRSPVKFNKWILKMTPYLSRDTFSKAHHVWYLC